MLGIQYLGLSCVDGGWTVPQDEALLHRCRLLLCINPAESSVFLRNQAQLHRSLDVVCVVRTGTIDVISGKLTFFLISPGCVVSLV